MPESLKDRRFICDYYSPGCNVIRIIRSSIPSGRIVSVSLPEAPEDCGYFRYDDIPGRKTLSVFKREIPVLSDGNIRYPGEPVLLVYGKDERLLEDIIAEIVIEYDQSGQSGSLEDFTEDQIDREIRFTRGKPERNFEKAARIIEETFTTAPLLHNDLEPQGAYASKKSGGIEVICASQWPYNVRDNVAAATGIPAKRH